MWDNTKFQLRIQFNIFGMKWLSWVHNTRKEKGIEVVFCITSLVKLYVGINLLRPKFLLNIFWRKPRALSLSFGNWYIEETQDLLAARRDTKSLLLVNILGRFISALLNLIHLSFFLSETQEELMTLKFWLCVLRQASKLGNQISYTHSRIKKRVKSFGWIPNVKRSLSPFKVSIFFTHLFVSAED